MLAPGLSAAIAGSFQLEMSPRKIFAIVGPSSRRCTGAPGTL